LIDFGFDIELVLADSLYGEASSFIRKLEQYKLPWVVAIRSNHGLWLPKQQIVRANKWCQFERIFSSQKSETRYIREIIFGKRRETKDLSACTYWEITTEPETMPENSTSFIMTNTQDKRSNMKRILGNLYGLNIALDNVNKNIDRINTSFDCTRDI
jgi:SRSO17 transposase